MMKLTKGFSLIELTIVITVLASLLVLALNVSLQNKSSLYVKHVQTDLSKLAWQLEQFRYQHNSYEVNVNNNAEQLLVYSPSHQSFANKAYLLEIQRATANDYLLRAIPVNANLPQLTLDSTGQKQLDKNLNGLFEINEQCWQC